MRSDYLATDALAALLWAMQPANALAAEVALATGWRIDDVLHLKTEQLNHAAQLKRPRLRVLEKKTGKPSSRYISRPLLERMRKQAGRRWCFEGARDWRKPRTRQAVYYDLKKAAAKFGLPQNISPHTLRKNYAVYLRHNGKTVGQVQRTLNHSNAMTTMLYMYADKLTEQKKNPGA